MNFNLLDLAAFAITQAATAAGVYAALKSDIREAVVRAVNAEKLAERAHARIDELIDR